MKLFYFYYKTDLDNCVSSVIANTYGEAESYVFEKNNDDILVIDEVREVDLDDLPTMVYTSAWKRGIFE